MFSVKTTNLTIQEAANRPNPVFFDSVFAIGKSAKDENLRYIKQLKVRYGNFEHGGNNMIVCVVERRMTSCISSRSVMLSNPHTSEI